MCHQEVFVAFLQVPPSHQLSGTIRQLAPCWSTTLPAAQSFYPSRVPAYPPTGQKATNWLLLGAPGARRRPPTQFREGGRHGGSPTGSRRPKQAPRHNGAPNHVVLGHVRGPGSPIPKIPFLWPRGLSDGGKPDAALSSWEDIYIGTGTLPLPYAAPTGTHHPQSNGTNLYIDWAKSPHTHQLAGASDHRQPSSPTGPPKPPTAREGANRPVIP